MPTIIIQLDNLDGDTGAVLRGAAAGDAAGFSVSGIGDVNGDGYDDVMIGARFADPNGMSNAGISYVVFGGPGGLPAQLDLDSLDGTNGFIVHGLEAGDASGLPVASAGDFNGDGIGDILLSAQVADPNGLRDAGEAYAIYGTSSGFAPVLDLADLNGANGFQIEGIEQNRNFGRAASSAGDVNGDGIDDIIFGASGDAPSTDPYNGLSYVVFGTTGNVGPSFDLASLNGTNGFVINGVAADDRAGFSVADAGDVNGDGIGDLIIGARFADNGGAEFAGEAYVVFGSDSGFPAQLELAGLDGTDGFRMSGLSAGDALGFTVSRAGDINNDGLDDIIVGARSADSSGLTESGAAYVVFGSASGFSADVDLAALDGQDGFRIEGTGAFDFLGHQVNDAGDFNGDGIDDLVVSALRGDGDGAVNAGLVYVLFGSDEGFSAAIDLDNLAPSQGLALAGAAAHDEAGSSVAGAGDVNGDGFDDLIIGAPNADTAGADAGAAYVVYGFGAGEGVDIVGTGDGEELTGTLYDDVIRARRGDDTLHGLAGNDVLRGDAGDDTIFGDSGNDTLIGYDGADTIEGGDGADYLNGQSGADHMTGGAGDDTYVLHSLTDTVVELDGGGYDTVRVLVSGYHMDPSIEEVRLYGAANDAVGSARDDTMVGGDDADLLTGRSGDDILRGRGGNDTLEGGDGDDRLEGGAGNDVFKGRTGNDSMMGGAGNDQFFVEEAGDTVSERGAGGYDVVFASVDFALSANVEEIRLIDSAFSALGNNLGNYMLGSDTANDLRGGSGADTLVGGGGEDFLGGGADNDTMIGGGGDDTLAGWIGADVFRFENASESGSGALDTILDFSQAEGDVIDLRAIDADTGDGGDDSFAFIGSEAFSGAAGELRFEQQDGATFVSGDVDGDGAADFTIRLEGPVDLTAGDFYI